MKTISGKNFCKLLESDSGLRISIPVHKNDDLKIGLLKKLLKITNILEDEL